MRARLCIGGVAVLMAGVALTGLATRAQADGSLVRNGDFELPAGGGHPITYVVPSGWSVAYGNLDFSGNLDLWDAASGRQSLDLNGDQPGGVYQDLSTVAGQAYVVRFAYAGNFFGPPATKTFDVKWGGTTVDRRSFNVTGRSRHSVGWTYVEDTVTAQSTRTRLEFDSTTRPSTIWGPLLDDVSVSAAVEPAVSTIASSLLSPGAAFSSPSHNIANAAITVGLILFITFPSQLVNRTIEENYDDIREVAGRRLRWLHRLTSRLESHHKTTRGRWTFALVVLAGAALGGLNDPNFGFKRTSIATYIAVVCALLFGAAVGAGVSLAYRRLRGRDRAAHLHALPAGLVIAAACVLVSRLTQFTPGYLYGVICGVAFTARLGGKEDGHNTALAAVATLSVAVLAWFAWVPVNGAATQPDAGFPTILTDDFLAAVFVGGLVGTVVGLLPLRFMPGGTLVAWSRTIWAVTFAAAIFGLVQVMLRPESQPAHSGKAPLVTGLLLFVGFGGFSFAFREYFSRRRERRAGAAGRAG